MLRAKENGKRTRSVNGVPTFDPIIVIFILYYVKFTYTIK